MNTIIKKSLAVLLSALMILSTVIVGFAQVKEDFTLTTSGKCYAGVTYDVVATVNNLAQEQLIGNDQTQSAFSWSTDNGCSIFTVNNYSIKYDSEDKTYTVSETARVTLPEELGRTVITAKYGEDKVKTLEVQTLQPIKEILISPESNQTGDYYYETAGDSSMDTLYLYAYKDKENKERGKDEPEIFVNAYLNIEALPEDNVDNISVGLTNSKYTSLSDEDGKLEIKFTSLDAPEEDTLSFNPISGYKFSKKIKLIECTPLESYVLSTGGMEIAESDEDGVYTIGGGVTNLVIKDSVTITPIKRKPTYSNDVIKYTLYSPDGELSPTSYYSVDNNGNCIVNPANPGTYTLVTQAFARGGYLTKNIGVSIRITFSDANPIKEIRLLELENGKFNENKPIEQISLYTTTKKTYDLSKNVSALPVGYTHGVEYRSSNEKIASIDKNGVITAQSSGTAKIFVSSEDNDKIVTSIDVRVVNELTSIDGIVSETQEIPQGHSIQLYTVTTPETTDENIRWSTNLPEALSIDINGYATARTDYDLGAETEQHILVTATSESGKTKQAYYTVVPSIPAKTVDAIVESDDIEINSENNYSIFESKTFSMRAKGISVDGIDSNDIYEWYVSLNGEPLIDLASAVALKYFTCDYNSKDDIYTITAKKSGSYEFFSFALKRGEQRNDNTVAGSFVINVYDRATEYTFDGIPSTMPAKSEKEFIISVKPEIVAAHDTVYFESDNKAVADVIIINNEKAKLVAGDTQGSAVITYKSKSGSIKKSFKVIVTKNILFADVSGVEVQYTYTGSEIRPVPTVSYEGQELKAGTHYTLTYSENINAGIASVIITGKGDYATSVKNYNFEIIPKSIENDDIAASMTYAYALLTADNKSPVPNITLKDNTRGKALVLDKDYTVEGLNNTEYGDATAVIKGCGNYSGQITREYLVTTSSDLASSVTLEGTKTVMPSNSSQDFKIITSPVSAADKDPITFSSSDESLVKIVKLDNNSARIITGSEQGSATITYKSKSGVISRTFALKVTKNISEAEVVGINLSGYEFTGSAIKPEIEVTYGGYVLNPTVDYSVTYQDNINAGTAKLIITGKGEFASSVKNVDFTITPKKLTSEDIEATVTSKYVLITSQNKAPVPNISVKDNTRARFLTSNTDYTISCTGNEKTGTANVTVTGCGNYGDMITLKCKVYHDYEITTSVSLNGLQTVLPTNSKCSISVIYAPINAIDTDPIVFSSDNEAVAYVKKSANDKFTLVTGSTIGTAKITYQSQSGSLVSAFNVTVNKNIATAVVTGIASSYTYNGTYQTPVPVVSFDGYQLIKDVHYSVSYLNNYNAGTATVTIIGRGEFSSSTKTITFKILPKSISGGDVKATLYGEYVTITDAAPKPLPSIAVFDSTLNRNLSLNTDYTLSGKSNTQSGTATATVTGTGNYKGTLSVKYKVCDYISNAKISTISNQKFTGTAKQPSVKVVYNGRTLKSGMEYTCAYYNNIYTGTATVTVTGIAPYFTGSLTGTFKIIPANVTGFKVTKKTSSSVTLQWKQDVNADGYQIYDVAAKKVVKTIQGNSNTSVTITKLSAQKAYQYKIRVYKSINMVNFYGEYSTVITTNTLPKAPSVTLKTSGKTITASWKKISGVSGYQYQFSKKSSFSGAKTVNLSSKATSVKLTKLTKGTAYYVRVRAYSKIKVGSKTVTVYSGWTTKNIKCK